MCIVVFRADPRPGGAAVDFGAVAGQYGAGGLVDRLSVDLYWYKRATIGGGRDLERLTERKAA